MILFKKLFEDSIVPAIQKKGDAGFDLYARQIEYEIPGATHLINQSKAIVSTGIACKIPSGYVGIIKPRSGLAIKNNTDVLGGVIDSNYTGEIKVILYNHSKTGYTTLEKGMRIAQMVVIPCITDSCITEELPSTDRGDLGFGSSGL